jgi:hypothetical protein
VTPAVGLGGLGQARNLGVGQVFPGPQFGVGAAERGDCSILVVGDTSLRRGFTMEINLPRNETVRRIDTSGPRSVVTSS